MPVWRKCKQLDQPGTLPTDFTLLAGRAGGIFIGRSAIVLTGGAGRIARLSGIFGGLFTGTIDSEFSWPAIFIAGLLFGAGVTVSGMVSPVKVLNFMDLFGQSDPTLTVVMEAGLIVTFIGYRTIFASAKPFFAASFNLPTPSGPSPEISVTVPITTLATSVMV